jgi:fused signal recognition particle receptor
LAKSRQPFLNKLQDTFTTLGGGTPWGENHPLWESLEESLLAADIGPKLSAYLLQEIRKDFASTPQPEELKHALRREMLRLLDKQNKSNHSYAAQPRITLLIGVNGAGKTTTAGKLAAKLQNEGKKVILGAADTFRAAAVDQLKIWADRLNTEFIAPAQGANPAAVAFDAAAAGLARNADEVIIDTAGRLQAKENLMEELKKIGRVLDKKIPGAPHRVLVVLDATLGQNAIGQAKEFSSALPATGIVLTKMDGSARGGAAFAAVAELGVPIEWVGLGEQTTDLHPFSAEDFVNHLLP